MTTTETVEKPVTTGTGDHKPLHSICRTCHPEPPFLTLCGIPAASRTNTPFKAPAPGNKQKCVVCVDLAQTHKKENHQ